MITSASTINYHCICTFEFTKNISHLSFITLWCTFNRRICNIYLYEGRMFLSQLSPTSWYFVSPPFANASLIWSRFSLIVDSQVASFLCRVCGCTARPKVDRHCMSFFLLLKSIILCNLPHVPYTQEFEQKIHFFFSPQIWSSYI